MSISRTARTRAKPSGDALAEPTPAAMNDSAVPHIRSVTGAVPPGPHVRSVSIEDNPIAQFFKGEQRNSLLISGDSEKALTSVPEGVFQTCVTSPPFWSLRDYNIAGQIGLERSVSDYIGFLLKVFAGVRRTLREDGTLWVNIRDSY